MRVLVIDDDVELSGELSTLLGQHNYQCDVAESMGDAKYLLDVRNYDLVLLGWRGGAPESTLHIIAEIKKEAHKTSFIVISERLDKESEIEALRSGADDYIRKPLDMDILLVRIEAKLRFGASY